MKRPAASLQKGAAWGAVAGLVLALLLLRRHPHLHLHGGEVGLIFAVCIALGAAAGAGFAWLKSRRTGDSVR